MLQRNFIRMARATVLSPQFGFAQAPKAQPEQPQASEVQEEGRRGQQGREEEEWEEEPLHQENRNTVGWWIYRFFFWGSFSILSANIYTVYTHRKKTPVEDEPLAVPYFVDTAKAIVRTTNEMIEFVTQPTSKKLLFDPVHPDLHPKTLVLNLTGTLLTSEYIFGKGLKITVRPGVDQLLRRLSQKYEIVIFAEEDEYTLMNRIIKIDPKQMHIRGVLGREAMVWKNGEFIKDLRYLNRDLKKVVVVDRRLQSVKNHPENTIVLPEFKGSEQDNELTKLCCLLEKLAEVPDVRKFLASLGDNPVETYYERALQFQERVNKKASIFSVFGSKPKDNR